MDVTLLAPRSQIRHLAAKRSRGTANSPEEPPWRRTDKLGLRIVNLAGPVPRTMDAAEPA